MQRYGTFITMYVAIVCFFSSLMFIVKPRGWRLTVNVIVILNRATGALDNHIKLAQNLRTKVRTYQFVNGFALR